jgi:hypothetical protein
MNRRQFITGLILCGLGLTIIVIMGSLKPPLNVPMAEWRARIAPVHVGWMFGAAICLLGVFLILKDTFSSNGYEPLDTKQYVLREEIFSSLAGAGMAQSELRKLIQRLYGRSSLVGLTTEQLERLLQLIKERQPSSAHGHK